MTIRILTDSGCDLPEYIIRENNIEVLPLSVHLGEVDYLDGVDIKPEQMYSHMREGKVYKTSQVPPSKFREAFIKYAEKKETCIYIGFSSGLSGTFQAATIAKEEVLELYPDFDGYTIDTGCASVGFGLVVYEASKMVMKGKSKEEILSRIYFYIKHMEHIFTVETLEYLFRGGRVSRTSAFIGGLLDIKPVLNVEKGKLIPIEKIRGRKKSLRRIVDIVGERGVDLKNQIIGISHGDCLDEAEKMKQMIEEKYGCKEFLINTVGSVIGAHSGPGTIAVFFLNAKEEK
ncbi:DegV domain-containing protein [Clostridium homopropionicum DSM 5847]|uniref:DegV domain-containing protein n=1 Tax=Clostridium homopropionicum DSM 5847 TaxID=1121318 RepID=A0A0L6ZBE5_9CLOT|nr:DegV family protein [Clostridium homopropionicum]KOA20285.1 DegV domain-containing protein [Clostridium homopropionicum DSM 5847]SFG79877.1 EDD domain protein, DegV family [Clostridium homopropionicum]